MRPERRVAPEREGWQGAFRLGDMRPGAGRRVARV